jgi:hypothetical protein
LLSEIFNRSDNPNVLGDYLGISDHPGKDWFDEKLFSRFQQSGFCYVLKNFGLTPGKNPVSHP